MANATELWAPARSRPAQDHLGGERRMPANLDCQMAPVGVKDMERVVDVRHRLFAFDVVRGFTSHTGAWARPTKTRNKPWVTVVLARYSSARHRNSVGLGVAAHTPAEAPGQPHQVSVRQHLVGAGQRPPPQAEPTGTMPHPEIADQSDAIDAIVTAAQQVLVENAQPIRHPGSVQLPRRPAQTAPQGPLFHSAVCEKA
jgi:hypothetical protein